MHMRELFTIDTQGWGVDHSANDFKVGDVDARIAETFCERKSEDLLGSGISKCEQPKETGILPPVFILVPLQVPRDYTILHHSPVTVRYFVDSLMAWAEESETHIGVKMHPFNKCDYNLDEAVAEGVSQSEYVHKVDGNIHELVKRSDGIFCINSGVGFESLIHGKPVATFGRSDYSKVTFNADLRRLNEAKEFLLGYTDAERNLAYQFVWWYWTQHAYDVYAADTSPRLKSYLETHL